MQLPPLAKRMVLFTIIYLQSLCHAAQWLIYFQALGHRGRCCTFQNQGSILIPVACSVRQPASLFSAGQKPARFYPRRLLKKPVTRFITIPSVNTLTFHGIPFHTDFHRAEPFPIDHEASGRPASCPGKFREHVQDDKNFWFFQFCIP